MNSLCTGSVSIYFAIRKIEKRKRASEQKNEQETWAVAGDVKCVQSNWRPDPFRW